MEVRDTKWKVQDISLTSSILRRKFEISNCMADIFFILIPSFDTGKFNNTQHFQRKY